MYNFKLKCPECGKIYTVPTDIQIIFNNGKCTVGCVNCMDGAHSNFDEWYSIDFAMYLFKEGFNTTLKNTINYRWGENKKIKADWLKEQKILFEKFIKNVKTNVLLITNKKCGRF